MKFKITKLLVITALLGVFLSACSDDESTSPNSSNTPTPKGSFEAIINGVDFTASTTYAILEQDTAEETQVLFLSGEAGGTEISIVFGESDLSEAFSLGTHSIAYLRKEDDTEKIFGRIASSTVTITKSDAATKTVSGTFKFTGQETGTAELINVQSGVFTDVQYRISIE